MSPSDNSGYLNALKGFAIALKRSYGSVVSAQQEDQLKGPTGDLLSGFGTEFGLNVIPRFEAPVRGVGRPDIALDVGGALCGYVELKAPQVSVRNLRGRDREQFNKFKTLPNLVYTNGNEWILYQDGEKATTKRLYREGEFVRLAAENPDYEDIVVAAEEVAVQGCVVKVIHTPR